MRSNASVSARAATPCRSDSSVYRDLARAVGATSLTSLALLLAAPAGAQPPSETRQIMEEIQVTGSRLVRSGFTSPVPVTSMEMGELSAFEPRGGLSEQLNSLPQFFFNTTPNAAATLFGTAGQSAVNMRAMGANRTLVLLDGARVVPSDRGSNVNVDYLPSALIRRVEVVTGGASAAYGADALAGVTNFILDRRFTGLETRVQAGINEWGDGETWRAEAAFGRPVGDRLHIFGSLETRENSEWRRGRADDPFEVSWAQDWAYVTNPEWLAATPAERAARQAAGEFLPHRLTRPQVHSTLHTPAGLIRAPGFTFDRHTFLNDGTGVRPYQVGEAPSFTGPGTFGTTSGGPEYENAKRAFPQGPGQNEVIQHGGFFGFDYELSDRLTFWGHGLFGRIESNQTEAGNPEHHSIWHMNIFQDNAFLPEAVRLAMITEGRESIQVHRNGTMSDIYGRNERNRNTHDMWSLTAGLDLDMAVDWNLRAMYQYGESGNRTMGRNWQRIDRHHMAVDAVLDPVTGDIVCRIQLVARDFAAQGRDLEAELHQWALANTRVFRHDAGRDPTGGPTPIDFPFSVDSIDNSISDCVPLNLFGQNNASREAVDYVHATTKIGLSSADQHFAEVMARGVLHQGWGPGPVEAAFGATYRKESVRRWVPGHLLAVDALGPPLNVTLENPDGTETVVMRGIPGGFTGGSPNLHQFSTFPSYSGGFDVWEVFNETIIPVYAAGGGRTQRLDLQLAARFAEYSRAGSVWTWKGGVDFQIFRGLRFRGTYSRDFREASFTEMFDLQGGGGTVEDPAFQNQSFPITVISGGNPALEPEEADTTVVGFVYRPERIAGLSLSVDWYDVDQTSRIGSLGAQTIVDECSETGALCGQVFRDENGVIQRVLNVNLNIDSAVVRGMDVEASYRIQPNFFDGRSESLSVRVLAGRLSERRNVPLGGTGFNQVGGPNLPEWSTTTTLIYNVGRFSTRLTQNWSSTMRRNVNWVEGVDVDSNHLPRISETNLGFSYDFEARNGNTIQTSLSVNNLFDRDPIIWPSFGQRGGSQLTIGDTLGRRYAVSFRYLTN
jgi:iron complex outermembrane recepter protein